jgi:hypothetical protein
MSPHPFPRRRVASPPLIPAITNSRPPTDSPRPWPDLSPETQIQIARILAGLLRRMLPVGMPATTEMTRADRRERR